MSKTVVANQASSVVIPETTDRRLLVVDFLAQRFKHVSREQWQQRMQQGRVYWHDHKLIGLDTLVEPKARVYYYRELESEPEVPLYEHLVFENENFVVAFKPHFLALNPSGNVIENCLVNRLRKSLVCEELTPAHRLDRATAGLVLLVKKVEHRHRYHELFASRRIKKTYQALSMGDGVDENSQWHINSRITKGQPSFRMVSQPTEDPNSWSKIVKIDTLKHISLFELEPITGKTHQLRLHMNDIGYPILNDRLYPELLSEAALDYSNPLKLLAQKLSFIDPLDQRAYDFSVAGFDLNTELL
ncbi:pseudouridine synthase [Alginatibacterium sediminis]|uniref:Pseudouridine synthase n=1 Tax=Alginatibacterium sediminis TaxID=2164068 RepID=A0A420EHH3_9ALTE|nr:pseudouridine synthase [Alginatibacterium sediminis]RKF20016.1 pseudouridine synthase [Alginatibacterium sediminis]